MSSFIFTKAVKEKQKLRLAIMGGPGTGKTWTSLKIATGMAGSVGGRIALIDTENGTASKYSDFFDFDQVTLPAKWSQDKKIFEFKLDDYAAAINAAISAGYPILIIDSTTHAWQTIINEVDHISKTRRSGNKWSAWSEGTPLQKQFVTSIVNYPGHIICTMRSKIEWAEDVNDAGKKSYKRAGTSPEQGKGIEYEFDTVMEMDIIGDLHVCKVIKDRTHKFQDRVIQSPDQELGAELIGWLSTGISPVDRYRNIIKSCAAVEELEHIVRVRERTAIAAMPLEDRKAIQEIYVAHYTVLAGKAPDLTKKKEKAEERTESAKESGKEFAEKIKTHAETPPPSPADAQKPVPEAGNGPKTEDAADPAKTPDPPAAAQEPPPPAQEPPKNDSAPDFSWVKPGARCHYCFKPGGNVMIAGCTIIEQPIELHGRMMVKVDRADVPVEIACLIREDA
jgi:hypothetical protein